MPGPRLLWRRSPFMRCLKKKNKCSILHVFITFGAPPVTSLCVICSVSWYSFHLFGLLWGKPRFNELFMNYPVISILVRLLDRKICTDRSRISSSKTCCSQTTANLWSSKNAVYNRKFSGWTCFIPDRKVLRSIWKMSTVGETLEADGLAVSEQMCRCAPQLPTC